MNNLNAIKSEDPVKDYNEIMHGPLVDHHFAIQRGNRWEQYTLRGELVYFRKSPTSTKLFDI